MSPGREHTPPLEENPDMKLQCQFVVVVVVGVIRRRDGWPTGSGEQCPLIETEGEN